MNPIKVNRHSLKKLTDLPNIGKASAGDLQLLGISTPTQLLGRCPFQMYDELCAITAQKHDPCVIDVFMSITRFMQGEEAQNWWHYTEERKQKWQRLSRT